jgi:hypothetical protein
LKSLKCPKSRIEAHSMHESILRPACWRWLALAGTGWLQTQRLGQLPHEVPKQQMAGHWRRPQNADEAMRQSIQLWCEGFNQGALEWNADYWEIRLFLCSKRGTKYMTGSTGFVNDGEGGAPTSICSKNSQLGEKKKKVLGTLGLF